MNKDLERSIQTLNQTGGALKALTITRLLAVQASIQEELEKAGIKFEGSKLTKQSDEDHDRAFEAAIEEAGTILALSEASESFKTGIMGIERSVYNGEGTLNRREANVLTEGLRRVHESGLSNVSSVRLDGFRVSETTRKAIDSVRIDRFDTITAAINTSVQTMLDNFGVDASITKTDANKAWSDVDSMGTVDGLANLISVDATAVDLEGAQRAVAKLETVEEILDKLQDVTNLIALKVDIAAKIIHGHASNPLVVGALALPADETLETSKGESFGLFTLSIVEDCSAKIIRSRDLGGNAIER